MASAGESEGAPRDETPVRRLALRDGALALLALSAFAAADVWYATTGLAFAGLVSILDGFGVGLLVAFGAHEWGHFAGARWAGGPAPTTAFTRVFPLFVFDMQAGSDRAFRAMGVGGNLAHWLVVALFALALPIETPGRAALLAGAFGFAAFASLTEFPVLRRAYAGAGPTQSFAGLTGEKLRRNRNVGIVAAIALFLLL